MRSRRSDASSGGGRRDPLVRRQRRRARALPDGIEDRTHIAGDDRVGERTRPRVVPLEDVGNAAVFAASDWGRSMTAAIVNVSCGALID